MRARPRQRPCPHGRDQPPSANTRGVRGLGPRTFSAKRRPNPGRKRSFRPERLGLPPAAEDEAAESEAESEGADGEAADREGLAPGGKSLPASERLALFRRQRLASALLADRAARSETEIEVVENLGRLFGHAGQTIASTGCAHTCFAPLRPPFRSR